MPSSVASSLRRLAAVVALVLAAGTASAQDDVTVELDVFGVGNVYRPGEHCGLRLVVTGSGLREATQVLVQIEIPNPDGDVAEFFRSFALNAGGKSEVWFNVALPWEFEPGTVTSVRVFEDDEGQRGRELGGTRILPTDVRATMIDVNKSMIAAVGGAGNWMELRGYTRPAGVAPGQARFYNEETRIIGVRPADFPDRWEALKGFEAIAWGGAFTPRSMPDPQVLAMREYIRRGGHLVIVLPDASNPWGLGSPPESELDDLLPTVAPIKVEDASLDEDLKPLLSKTRGTIADDRMMTVHVFGDVTRTVLADDEASTLSYDRIGNHYRPLLALDDGRIVAVQRTYGFGRITVLGIDLNQGQLTSQPQAIQTDMIWNPILGRRMDTPSGQELNLIDNAGRLSRVAVGERDLGGGRLFEQVISMSEDAGKGLAVAFFLFLVYWFVAGPGGFFVLKHYRLERHAWLAFAMAAAVFTATAWGIVALIKPRQHKVKHLTYLDMIARPGGDREGDPQFVRAVSWFSVNLPGYRRTPVFLESETGHRDLLSSWSGSDSQPFPNPDRYRVDVQHGPADQEIYERIHREDRDFRRPTRATATQMYANYLGGLDADWGGIVFTPTDDPLRVEIDAGGNEILVGKIAHDLPVEIEDVTLIWIKNNRISRPKYGQLPSGLDAPWVQYNQSGQMTNTGIMIKKGRWPAGTEWDVFPEIESFGAGEIVLQRNIFKKYIEGRLKTGFMPGAGTATVTDTDARDYFEMLSFFQQLDQPTYLTANKDIPGEDSALFYRMVGRELDLSTWFSGPCVIVIGHMRGAEIPLPLLVDGDRPKADEGSRVVLRWIYPLEVKERIAFRMAFEKKPDDQDPDRDPDQDPDQNRDG